MSRTYLSHPAPTADSEVPHGASGSFIEFWWSGMLFLTSRGLMLMLLAACFAVTPAQADGDNSGSGNSGSGGDASGGDDDSDDDNDDDNDDSDRDNRQSSRDQERALKAVKGGKIVSLAKLKHHLKSTSPGKILKVELKKRSGTYFYRVRILTSDNRIKALTLNALSLKQEKL
jgi:uncharacterized membrane protein YkoI